MDDRADDKLRRARKRQRNLVAKHARSLNKAATHRDRKKQPRDKHPAIAMQESLESTQSDV